MLSLSFPPFLWEMAWFIHMLISQKKTYLGMSNVKKDVKMDQKSKFMNEITLWRQEYEETGLSLSCNNGRSLTSITFEAQ